MSSSFRKWCPPRNLKSPIDTLAVCEARGMHGQLPVAWHGAKGFLVTDIDGNRFIDLTSGIFIANVGHSNEVVLSAIRRQLDAGLISCYNYPTDVRADYCSRLVDYAGAGLDKCFLLSAGTEATEAALKVSRLYSRESGKRGGVILCKGNWHGRTAGAQLLSDNRPQSAWCGYSDPNVYHIDFPFPWALEGDSGSEFFEKQLSKLAQAGVDISSDIGAFFLETFQGWAGAFYPVDFVKAIRNVCDNYGILLVFDEVQSGFGRTGRNFGYEHYEVQADLLICGKAMGGGVPISGIIGRAELLDLAPVGQMSSTHSANPLACAAGLAVLEEMDRHSLALRSAQLGNLMHREMASMVLRHGLRASFGKGLIGALIFDEKEKLRADKVVMECMENRVLVVRTGRESIKLGPPLTIKEDALVEALTVLDNALAATG